jgi:mannosyltransferase OCH1-like enzyme
MIENNILQTYESAYTDLPEGAKACIESWKHTNPWFNHTYYSAEDRNKFVLENFGEDWYKIFNSLNFNIMKANIWRYMALYKVGGIYSDIDMFSKTTISQWVDTKSQLVLCGDSTEKNEFTFRISVMASKKDNNIMKHVLDYAKDVLSSNAFINDTKFDKYYIFKYSGEVLFKNSIDDFLGVKSSSLGCIDYLDLLKSHGCLLYCQDDLFHGQVTEHYDGAKNWQTGYNNWYKEVGA